MDSYLETPFIMSISASNGSGKTYFIKYCLKSLILSTEYRKKPDVIFIFSNTAEMTGDFDFLNDYQDVKTMIFNPIVFEEKTKKILILQKALIQRGIKRKLIFIFDDVGGFVRDSKLMKTLISMNRHFNASIFFSIQYINLSAPYLREISNYDVIFDLKSENSLKACYNNYFLDTFDTYAEFKKKFLNLLKRYQFFFIDKLKKSKKIMVCP